MPWLDRALEIAATMAIVRMLLARGTKQVRPGAAYMAMFWAVGCSRIEIVRLLLTAPGASDALNTKVDNRITLKLAIDQGYCVH